MANSLFTELKRRNVFKVGVAYLVLAWVVVQVTDSAVPALHLPEWVNSFVFFIGAIGFPFALFFAWAFEITPEGIKKESEITPEESITAHTGRKLDFIIIGLLVIVAGYFIYESRFEYEPEEEVVAQNNTSKAELLKEAKKDPEGSSIAVLPFVNMSDDASNEYFSDGISEEILNVLAKLPRLKVTSRSSAFAFKGKELNLTEVAKKLGVKNILEGSVRKSGNRVRITAQLIEAESDTHLWSETYDRELTDIFAIQDEIAAAIVEALKSKLGLETKLVARDMSKVNLDAHNEYLKGRFYVEKRTQRDLEKALGYFENSIELAPDYAPAWMGKAWASLFLSERNYGNILPDIAIANARPAAEKALLLDGELPEANAIMGLIESADEKIDKAIVHYKKAIALNPNYADAYGWYSDVDTSKQLELLEKAVKLNPMSIIINSNYGHLLRRTQQFDKATEVAQHMLDIDNSSHHAYQLLRFISFDEGKPGEALFYQEKAVQLNPTLSPIYGLFIAFYQYGLVEQAISVWQNTPFYEAIKAYVNKDFAQSNKIVGKIFPRNENDKTGALQRAISDTNAGHFKTAVKYFIMAESTENTPLIYSYQQLGEIEAANSIIDKWKVNYAALIKAGRDDIDSIAAKIAFAENDINKMVKDLKLHQTKQEDYILNPDYAHIPMYEKLREHQQWQEILAESDRRAAKVRDAYLRLVDRDVEVVARTHKSKQSEQRIEVSVATEILKNYVGVYVLTPEFSNTVTFENGSLFIQGTNQSKFKIAPESESKFFSLSHNDKFSFQRDDKGEVVSLIEHDKTFNQKYIKVR